MTEEKCGIIQRMILYHGSNLAVTKPELLNSSHGLDFGAGFYTTTNRDQAADFAKKVVDRNDGQGSPIVTSFLLDEHQAVPALEIRQFPGPTDDWLDFVVDNRRRQYVGPAYDLKIGPVANDNVYRTIQLYMTGVLTREQTIDALKVRKLYNQYVFSSVRALSLLRFLKSEVV